MKRVNKLAAVIAALAPTAVFAELNYSSVDVNFVDLDVEVGSASISGDGIELSGSYELNDNVFLLGRWQDQSYDFNIDGTAFEFGAGYNHEMSSDFDLIGTVSYVEQELSLGGFGADDDGLALGGGVRGRLSDSIELGAMLRWIDFDQAGSDTGYDLFGRYFFRDTLALTLGAEFNDNVDVLRFGFRAEF